MKVLTYKDFQGSVEYEDGRLVIQVLHIDDTVVDEVVDASAAQQAFEDLVEDYLETCRAVGKEPCRPFKGSFNVRLAPDLHKAAAMAAAARGVSLNQWVASAIARALEESSDKRWGRELADTVSD